MMNKSGKSFVIPNREKLMNDQRNLPNLLDILIVDQPSIFMTQEQKDKWLTALRSGEFKQEQSTLQRDGGYCCLGLLEQVISGDCETGGLPSIEWLDANGITFRGVFGRNPGVECDLLEVDDAEQLPFGRNTSLSSLNDSGYTFTEIADALEKIIEVRS